MYLQQKLTESFPRCNIYETSIQLIFGDEQFWIYPNENLVTRMEKHEEKPIKTKLEFTYNKSLLFEKNKNGLEKKRLITFKFKGNVMGLDVGYDGRLFWKVWKLEDYYTFRKPPYWVASFWIDGLSKRFYLQDLKEAVKIW